MNCTNVRSPPPGSALARLTNVRVSAAAGRCVEMAWGLEACDGGFDEAEQGAGAAGGESTGLGCGQSVRACLLGRLARVRARRGVLTEMHNNCGSLPDSKPAVAPEAPGKPTAQSSHMLHYNHELLECGTYPG